LPNGCHGLAGPVASAPGQPPGASGSASALRFTAGENDVYLPLVLTNRPATPVASPVKPFDVNTEDLVGPADWMSNYGKRPELIVASSGSELDVLAQDYDPQSAWKAALLHIVPNGSGYRISQALTNIPMLDRVMGLAVDTAGYRYYATAIDEEDVVSPTYPPLDTYRTNIVRVIKLNAAGQALFNIDVDIARHNFDPGAAMLINPMTAGSARLAVGGGRVALSHSGNTDPDWNINGTRHQYALFTQLDANTGAITRTGSVWASHSFDQRLFFDGQSIIEHHLADAYPRYIVFGRNYESYPLFHIKGPVGENLTATRLGNIALIQNDPTYGYIALFASESTSTAGDIFNHRISGPRNLAIVRVNRSDNSLDPNLPHTLAVTSADVQQVNRLRWLTSYTAQSNLHAERPKLVGIGGDRYVALWEQWLNTGSDSDVFQGVYGVLIDAQGSALLPARLLTGSTHLPRGDDAFFLNGSAAWVTGNGQTKALYVHVVDQALNYRLVPVE
jgi:hypothetical protein